MKRLLHILLSLTILLFGVSCSTQKAKWLNIRYHNLTCHYNVWWNGNESLKAGKLKLYQSVADDYSLFLTPEPIGTEENAQSIQPEMDRAIEKGVKGVQKHSIMVKGEEKVPYIKECYLLTAYASFYKQDYASALNSCNILLSRFPNTQAAAEAAVLTARCMVYESRHAEAETLLDQLVADLDKGKLSKSVDEKLYVAMIEALIPQEKFKKAVEYIHLALDATSSSQTKARLNYLMAQIYQHLGRRSVAAKYYGKVPTYSPPYIMEFNARLGEASCADFQHTDIKKIERQLDKMARDAKNTEYLDRIYYAKGEMYLGVKDAQKACDNFRRSVALAPMGSSQKARSALRVAEILYDLYENYDLAYRYYDTVVQSSNRELPGFAEAKRRHTILHELVAYTEVYTRADSLLSVAALPEAKRIELINAQIDSLRHREKVAQENALLQELASEAKAQSNTLTGDWYFYNSSTVQKGKETFRQRWGMRMLEDLWFLSDKNVTSFSAPTALSSDDTDSPTTAEATSLTAKSDNHQSSATSQGDPNDPHSVAYYLKELPSSQHQLDSIDSLIAPSLLGAAYIYYDAIGNIPLSLQCYHRLAEEYTSNPQTVQAFYMLYRIYDRQGNTPQADYYRDMVLLGFPDSDFANLIRDEHYQKQLLLRQQRINELYATVYDYFQQHRYASSIGLVDEVEADYPAHSQLPKFRFWKALSLAQTGRTDDAITLLQSIVSAASSTDSIYPIASAQLKRLQEGITTTSQAPPDQDATTQVLPLSPVAPPSTSEEPVASSPEEELPPDALIYRYRAKQQYYVVLIVNDRTIKATELQYRLADFNSQYYPNNGYKANAVLFTDTTQLITIHRFSDETEAMRYYRHLQSAESPLRAYADSDHTEFVISTQNYPTFYNRKNLAAYLAFFNKYYIKKQ